MSVSKRLRFEVLRRDKNTCVYCGATAADGPLTVDHVIPKSLGGTDHPNNLVTACRDCNSGKSSSAPGAPVVEEARLDARRWKRTLEAVAAERTDRRLEVVEAWNVVERMWPWSEPPEDWKKSVEAFVHRGLTAFDIEFYMHKAIDAGTGYDHVWRYFCKVAWSEVGKIADTAAERLAADPVVYEVNDPAPVVEREPIPLPPVAEPYPMGPVYALCIECDERPANIEGMCDACRSFHLFGEEIA